MNRIRKTILLTTEILTRLVLSACGTVIYQSDREIINVKGALVEENRTISGVSGVELATIGDLHIEVGSSESLTVKAQENLMEYIETKVVGGNLIIGVPSDVEMKSLKPIDYYLTVKDLDMIKILSSGNIEAPDLEAEQFSVSINSSGDVTMGDLNADTLEVDINSSGKLDIAGGEIKTQNIRINSSGKYTAKDLVSDEADVQINSSGSVTIWVKENLTATINSSGDVRYRGNALVDASGSSSGKVIHIDE